MPVRTVDTSMLQQALAACAKRSAELFQQKALIVDDEYYGVIDLPRSMNLFRGRVLRFPGYGDVQATSVSADTLRCSRTVDSELAAAAMAAYPLTVVPAALSRSKPKETVSFDEPLSQTPMEFL